jgi:hypothetical protein
MKSLKAFLTIFTLIFAIVITSAQSEKTLVKSFNLKEIQVVVLNLDGEVEVKEWKNPIMRVQLTVMIEKGSDSMLKSLVRTGRYNLYSKINDGDFEIFAPGTKKEIRVSGQKLEENISYIVYVPENVIVRMAGEASTDAETTPPTESSSL